MNKKMFSVLTFSILFILILAGCVSEQNTEEGSPETGGKNDSTIKDDNLSE